MDEEKERKPDKVIKIKVPKFTKKFRENPWIVSTFVLIVLAIVLVVNGSGNGGITGGVISEDDAGDIVLDLAKSQVRDAEVIEINSKNGLYEVILLMDGEEVMIYITKDGKNLVSLTPLSYFEQQPSQEEQEGEDWSIFEQELPENIKAKILAFPSGESEMYDEDLRITEFTNYELIPKTLIVFYNPGCGACRGYFSVLVETMEKYPEITIYALNSGQNRNLAEKYDVTGVPTTIINVKYKIVGSRPLESLTEILDKLG